LARVKEIKLNADKLQFVMLEPRLSHIKIVGLNRMSKESVAQFFETKINQPFNTNQIRADRERLIRTGLFSSVGSPEINQDINDNSVSVQLNVVERKPNRLELGLENDAEKTVAYIKGIRNHLLIPTDTLSGKLQYNRFDLSEQTSSNLWNHYQISYRQPYVLNRFPFSAEISVWHDVKVSVSSGQLAAAQKVLEDAVRRGQMATIGIPIKRDKVVLKLKLKNESITPQSQFTAVAPYRINSLLSELGYATTNSRFNPTSGSYVSIFHEEGVPFFERNIRFRRTIIDAATFFSLTAKTVMGFHGNFGVFQSKEDNAQTYETEQFLLGGTYTLRGYNESDYPFSGAKKLLFNIEMRQTITPKIQVVLFYDFGTVGPYSVPIRWDDFNYGYGAGIRFLTPIGPIRLELARNDQAQTQVHFGLGQLF
jgi:outer membrane protein assembly factor BamA